MKIRTLFLGTLLVFSGAIFSYGQQPSQEEVTKTLNAFHQAIVDNDSQAAQKLLSESAKILESGNIETKEEYLSHHFHSDGKFLSSMKREIESRNVSIDGNTAWVSTQTHTWGTYNERKLDLSSLELAVLTKENGTWKIAALHWSSTEN